MPFTKSLDTPGAKPVIPAKAVIHDKSKRNVTKHSLIALIHHLESAINSMQWQSRRHRMGQLLRRYKLFPRSHESQEDNW